MKAAGDRAQRYLEGQSPLPLTLIYGEETARIREMIQRFAKHVLGENALDEIRLDVFDYPKIAKDPALIFDALRAPSFFGGKRGVLIYNLTDQAAELVPDLLSNWGPEDAYIFAMATSLRAGSRLRKILEPHPQSMLIGVYNDPPTRTFLLDRIKKSGLNLTNTAQERLLEYALEQRGEGFDSLLETLVLWQGTETQALDEIVLETLLPLGHAGKIDEIVHFMLTGQIQKMLTHIRRAPAQGLSLAGVTGAALRRVLVLYRICTQGNPQSAIAGLRPPVFGINRTNLEAQILHWNMNTLEKALDRLGTLEASLRQEQKTFPEIAGIERVFIRIALDARKTRQIGRVNS